jgi:demethylmenaquinone methyltransferase/2-methoxy-6-polyprenyl-1,4-benzoquinol methylase
MRNKKRERLRALDLHNARTKLRYNVDLFAEVAPKYRHITKVLSFGRDPAWKRQLLSYLPTADAVNALDIACGPGDFTFPLSTRYPSGTVVGLDASPEMLRLAERARKRFPASGRHRISFVEGDMARMPFADGSFDIVTGGYALRNAPNLDAALAEIYRVLASGGTGAILEFSRSPNPVLSELSFRLLRLWGQLWGLVFHGDPDVYAYIAYSLRAFPNRAEFKRRLREAGFTGVRDKRLMFGMLAITCFERPSPA